MVDSGQTGQSVDLEGHCGSLDGGEVAGVAEDAEASHVGARLGAVFVHQAGG